MGLGDGGGAMLLMVMDSEDGRSVCFVITVSWTYRGRRRGRFAKTISSSHFGRAVSLLVLGAHWCRARKEGRTTE